MHNYECSNTILILYIQSYYNIGKELYVKVRFIDPIFFQPTCHSEHSEESNSGLAICNHFDKIYIAILLKITFIKINLINPNKCAIYNSILCDMVENVMPSNLNLILLKAESGKRKAESGKSYHIFSIKVKKNL